LLCKLDIKYKLISITSDSTIFNKTLIDKVEAGLYNRFPNSSSSTTTTPRFKSQSSYIQYIVYILNQIVNKLLETLKSQNCKLAKGLIKLLSCQEYFNTTDSLLARLQVLVIWILQIPERKS
jgi:hypothetical protein